MFPWNPTTLGPWDSFLETYRKRCRKATCCRSNIYIFPYRKRLLQGKYLWIPMDWWPFARWVDKPSLTVTYVEGFGGMTFNHIKCLPSGVLGVMDTKNDPRTNHSLLHVFSRAISAISQHFAKNSWRRKKRRVIGDLDLRGWHGVTGWPYVYTIPFGMINHGKNPPFIVFIVDETPWNPPCFLMLLKKLPCFNFLEGIIEKILILTITPQTMFQPKTKTCQHIYINNIYI